MDSSKHTKDVSITSKDKESADLLERAFRQNVFLRQSLSSKSALKAVISAMQLRMVSPKTVLIAAGSLGEEMFVCASGSLSVRESSTNKQIATIGPGDVFGEMAMVYGTPRKASVVALTRCKLWVIDRTSYFSILKKHFTLTDDALMKFLKTVPILRELSDESLSNIQTLLRVECYPPKTPIIKQGEEGQDFFMITGGTVAVTVKCSDGTEKQVGRLKKGEFFGEGALLEKEKRRATVIAEEPGVECIILDGKNFSHFLGDVEKVRKAIDERKTLTTEVVVNNNEYRFIQLEDLTVKGIMQYCQFGRIDLAQYKADNKLVFALKVVNKADVEQYKLKDNILNEKKILFECQSPFIVRLYNTFKDRKCLYYLQEACLGGDLRYLLEKMTRFDPNMAIFITACVMEAMNYLHSRGIVHRDLKSENLFLDLKGYAKLMNFGHAAISEHLTADPNDHLNPMSSSSTMENVVDQSTDYWSLGTLIYEMLTGERPSDMDDVIHSEDIKKIDFPTHVSKDAKLIIKKLWKYKSGLDLESQIKELDGLQNHKWFEKFNWRSLQNQTMKAPYIPKIEHSTDLSNFPQHPKDKAIPPDVVNDWDFAF